MVAALPRSLTSALNGFPPRLPGRAVRELDEDGNYITPPAVQFLFHSRKLSSYIQRYHERYFTSVLNLENGMYLVSSEVK